MATVGVKGLSVDIDDRQTDIVSSLKAPFPRAYMRRGLNNPARRYLGLLGGLCTTT